MCCIWRWVSVAIYLLIDVSSIGSSPKDSDPKLQSDSLPELNFSFIWEGYIQFVVLPTTVYVLVPL